MLQQIPLLEALTPRILRKLPNIQTRNVYLNIRYCTPPFLNRPHFIIPYPFHFVKITYSRKKIKTEKATCCVTFFVLAPPPVLARVWTLNQRLPAQFTGLLTHPPPLRSGRVRKFALSAGSEGQTLRSAALRAAAC